MTLEVYCQACAQPHPELLELVPSAVREKLLAEPMDGETMPAPSPYRFAGRIPPADPKGSPVPIVCTPDSADRERCWSTSYLCTRRRKK